jgi:hypothetical protein
MFIETRFFHNGEAEIRLCFQKPTPPEGATEDSTRNCFICDNYDYYVDVIEGKDLEKWVAEMWFNKIQIKPFIAALLSAQKRGKWLNISEFI